MRSSGARTSTVPTAARADPASKGRGPNGRPNRLASPPARSASKRADIIAAGVRLFAERPYDAVSIDDVADEAGVAHGLIYYYYGDKRGLFAAAVSQVSEEFLAFQRPRPGEVTPAERFHGALSRHFQYVRDNSARFRLLIPGTYPDNSLQETLRKRREEVLRGVLCFADPPPLVRAATRGWVGFLDHVTQVWLEDASIGLDEVVELCMHTLAATVEVAFGQRFDLASTLPVLTEASEDSETSVRMAG